MKAFSSIVETHSEKGWYFFLTLKPFFSVRDVLETNKETKKKKKKLSLVQKDVFKILIILDFELFKLVDAIIQNMNKICFCIVTFMNK